MEKSILLSIKNLQIMTTYQELLKNVPSIEKKIGYQFSNKTHLVEAFTHSSFVNEYKEKPLPHNERLEFLGDSVLNLFISEYLFSITPHLQEGELSFLKSCLVSSSSCLEYLELLKLEKFLIVGKGELIEGAKRKNALYADLFEALLGALFLDGGLEAAKSFFFAHFTPLVEKKIKNPEYNFKTLLQEHLAKIRKSPPSYRILEESGPDHNKSFVVGVFIEEVLSGQGKGHTKKEAEQNAAKEAHQKFKGASI
jgi:ribonuclease III